MKTTSPERTISCGSTTLRLARYVVDHLQQALGFERKIPHDPKVLLTAIGILRNVLAGNRAREFTSNEQTITVNNNPITFNAITVTAMFGYLDQLESLAQCGTRIEWGN